MNAHVSHLIHAPSLVRLRRSPPTSASTKRAQTVFALITVQPTMNARPILSMVVAKRSPIAKSVYPKKPVLALGPRVLPVLSVSMVST